MEVLNKALTTNSLFEDSFLKMEGSFPEIVSALGAQGKSLDSQDVVQMFGGIVEKKQKFCSEPGAWEQYEHLASWLIRLGALLEIKGRSLEEPYLKAVKYSMEHMSEKKRLGYSWHAFRRWDAGWKNIRASSRALIRKYIEIKSTDPDAKNIVSRA